jgi:hypothetical protein
MGLPLKLLELYLNAASWLFETGKKIIRGLVNGIIRIAPDVWKWFTDLPGTIKEKIGNAVGWLVEKGKDIIEGIITGIGEAAVGIWNFFTGLPGTIIEKIGAVASEIVDIGKDIAGWILDGIQAGWHTITDWIGKAISILNPFDDQSLGEVIDQEIGEKIIERINALFGISSPSKVFQAIGENLMDGLRIGLETSAAPVAKTLKDMASQLQDAIPSDLLAQFDASANRQIAVQLAAVPLAVGVAPSIITQDNSTHRVEEGPTINMRNGPTAGEVVDEITWSQFVRQRS